MKAVRWQLGLQSRDVQVGVGYGRMVREVLWLGQRELGVPGVRDDYVVEGGMFLAEAGQAYAEDHRVGGICCVVELCGRKSSTCGWPSGRGIAVRTEGHVTGPLHELYIRRYILRIY